MKPIGKDELIAVLRIRFDYYSAESVFELAAAEAGIADRTSLDAEEVVAFANALKHIGDRVEPVIQHLQTILPAGTPFEEPHTGEAAAAEATTTAPAGGAPAAAGTHERTPGDNTAAAVEPSPPEAAADPPSGTPAPGTNPDEGTDPSEGVTILLRAATPGTGEVLVCGGLPELGDWKPEGAAAMKPMPGDLFSLSLSLPPKHSFEFKFLRRASDGEIEWEGGDNRSFTVPDNGSSVLEATWGQAPMP